MPIWSKPADVDEIRAFSKAKKAAARVKYQEILDGLLADGYERESANRKADAWLKSIEDSWDDFERDQIAILAAKLGQLK